MTDEAAMTSVSEQLFKTLIPSLSSPERRTSKETNGDGTSPASHTPEETAAAAQSSFIDVAPSTPVGLLKRRSVSPAPPNEVAVDNGVDKGVDKDDDGPPEVEVVMPDDEEE